METFDKILALTKDEKVELGSSFKELMHKELCLGMTRYVCRYGTLGDGHEILTDAQKYYQANKELWVRSCAMKELEAKAMEAQADLIDSDIEIQSSNNRTSELRAQAKKIRAENSLVSALVQAEDTLRQMDEFNRVRLELQEKVRAQYPEGIEQAEPDHWRAVARYRFLKGNQEQMSNIPMPVEEKAKLGVSYKRQDMFAPLIIEDERKAKELVGITHG